jgi:hypothetical protein
MKKVRVPVHRTSPTQSVLIDPAATNGAQIGVNLLLPDGSVGTLAQLQALFGSTGSITNTTVNGNEINSTDDLEEGRYNWYGNVDTRDVSADTHIADQGDNDTILRGTAAGGLTITVPAGACVIGATLYALQGAAGAVKFVAGSGVTFLPSDSAATRNQGSLIAIKQTSQDVWEPVGDLAYFAPAATLTGNPSSASAQPVNIPLTTDGHVLIRRGGVLVSGKVAALEVTFAPTGNIASTDVQAALAELDTEKVDKTQLASAVGAGMVGNTPAGNIAATTVQGALNELDAEKATITGAETFAIGAGTAQAITAVFTPAITALVDGEQIKVRAFLANTAAAPTLKVNALTAYPITKNGGFALVAGDIKGVGHELLLRYVAAGPRFELLNPAVSGGGGSSTVASVQAGNHISVDATDPANPVIAVTGLSAGAGYAEGTSFPALPGLNDKFYRTDLNLLCYYDGTQWLTACEYALPALNIHPFPQTISDTSVLMPVRTDFAIYLTRWVVSTFRTGGSWTVNLVRFNATASATTIATFSSSSDAVNTMTHHDQVINANLDAAAIYLGLQLTLSGTGGIYVPSALYYRLIVT